MKGLNKEKLETSKLFDEYDYLAEYNVKDSSSIDKNKFRKINRKLFNQLRLNSERIERKLRKRLLFIKK